MQTKRVTSHCQLVLFHFFSLSLFFPFFFSFCEQNLDITVGQADTKRAS